MVKSRIFILTFSELCLWQRNTVFVILKENIFKRFSSWHFIPVHCSYLCLQFRHHELLLFLSCLWNCFNTIMDLEHSPSFRCPWTPDIFPLLDVHEPRTFPLFQIAKNPDICSLLDGCEPRAFSLFRIAMNWGHLLYYRWLWTSDICPLPNGHELRTFAAFRMPVNPGYLLSSRWLWTRTFPLFRMAMNSGRLSSSGWPRTEDICPLVDGHELRTFALFRMVMIWGRLPSSG